MRIPYSELRFSSETGAVWGINLIRNIRRYNSNNTWNFIDREIAGFIHQSGELKGITNIKPPIRLSFSPYAASYAEFSNKPSSPDFVYKGGMDVKYGISESFTLDMMLIPDFGQIQSDDKELNLSPYEIYYGEKRQFFTEGTELFNRAGIFYSRRIGAAPKFGDKADDALAENEIIDYNPTETQLVNATKISGRTSSGWGLGTLNAMTLASYSVLKDTITGAERRLMVQPFTNYNVSVIDRSLKNNFYISFINSNVSMINNPFFANVGGTDFQLRNKAKSFSFSGKAGVSVRNDKEKETGFYVGLGVDKTSGKLQYGISQYINSDKFTINDLGYMRRNNEMMTEAYISYRILEPFSVFREMQTGLWWNHTRIFKPNVLFTNQAGVYSYALFNNNYGIELNFNVTGNKYDYYEPRVKNRYFYEPYQLNYNIYAHSDSRKALSINGSVGGYSKPDFEENCLQGGVRANIRVGRHLQFYYGIQAEKLKNDRGYVDKSDDNTIYFAKRNIKTYENVVNTTYTLNNKASLSFRVRHYWSGAANTEYYTLLDDGSLIVSEDYNENHDENYNAVNADLVFRWIFAPGSEISLAWKNSILDSGDIVREGYFENLGNALKADQTNSISFKILYYIDYNTIRNKLR